jgi:hypothetical protein
MEARKTWAPAAAAASDWINRRREMEDDCVIQFEIRDPKAIQAPD